MEFFKKISSGHRTRFLWSGHRTTPLKLNRKIKIKYNIEKLNYSRRNIKVSFVCDIKGAGIIRKSFGFFDQS